MDENPRKIIILPPVTADSDAMFFEDENPAEARLLEMQYENAQYIWQSIVHMEGFRAAQYMTQTGQARILSPSTRDGIDWQLSYIGADGIPNMHGNYIETEHMRDENNPEEIFRTYYHPEDVIPQGHSMKELFRELALDGGRQERTVTLLLDETQEGDNNVDERNSLFIAEMAKLYAVYNRTPIDPESDLFRAYEEKYGTTDRTEYQRILTDTLITEGQPPRLAILQPQMDSLAFMRYADVQGNEEFKSENYEIVYISDAMGEATPNEVYEIFNEPVARPGDYYGTSVSVGNVLVYEQDGKFTAHFVNDIGFTELHEDFLDWQTRQKIQFGLDVRQEQDLLQRNIDFVTEQGVDLDISQNIARLETIKRDFEVPFRLSDLRSVNEAYQNVLETIYEYQQESGRNYGVLFSDGMYYAADTNDSDRIFSDNAEDYRLEINNRLARVAQRIAQENKIAYHMEATPDYRGEPGQYPFFVQKYEQAEPGTRIPEEVVFMGDAESASYFMNHINTMTALGEELLVNAELRRTLNMPVLQGGIDKLLITDIERETNALIERVDERTALIQQAMEAAGYTYDEINSAEEPDGEQYFNYEGGHIRFANEAEVFEWISGAVLDDPERQEAVDRVLHPEAFQEVESTEPGARSVLPEKTRVAIESTEDFTEGDHLPIQEGAEGRIVDNETTERVQYTYYSLYRPVSPGTYPRDGLVDFENFDRRSMVENIGREAWAVLHYDRELTEREMMDYELVREPQIIPIREFFDNDRKILIGSDIGLDRETGQVDRTRIYEAVRDFENVNREIVRNPVIDRDGDYSDRTTLYSGYDQYVGMSHMQDGELTPYQELIEAAVQKSERGSSKDWLKEVYTAEVYYAHVNGLAPDQIQYMVEKSAETEAELPVFTSAWDSMRNIRHAFEQGMNPEQVDVSLGQEDSVQQTILQYLHDGGDVERAKALRGADVATAHYISMEYGNNNLSAEKAAAIVQTVQEIHNTRVEREGISPTPNFYMEEDYITEALAEISRDSNIHAEAIRQIGADFAAQTEEEDLRKFIESQKDGIASYYPHGEDGRQIDGEIVRRMEAQVTVQAASMSSIPGYVVMSQFDRDGHTPGESVYLGLEENYSTDRGVGIYDNSDNSLVHVSDNPKMFNFFDASRGWTLSQQEMIDNGTFTAADYAEYDRIQQELIADFPGAQTKYFSIETEREESGIPFSPNWQAEVQRPHGEEERSGRDMTREQKRSTEGVSQPEEKKSARDLLAEQLTQGVKDVMNSDVYKNWLSTSSRMFTKSYSFNNAMLIFAQKPEASYAMGYEAWKEYGRNVAQGAHGAKIFVPVIAYEKTEGALHRMIMSNLREQVKQNPGQTAVYKVGMSKCEFTMNERGQVGLRLNGKERGIFANQQDMKKFISSAILGKIPMYYNVGTVFDVKDTVVPEYLWVKKGYTKDEVVKDDNGKPIKNKRGEVKIVNTPERQARFQPDIDLSITEKDPAKMEILYESLKTVSERNGIPVTDVPRDSDETLKYGADGYFSRQFSEQNPKGFIIMPDDLEPTRKCAVLIHEMGHSDLHGNLAKLAAEMQEKNIPRNMREIQAESVAFAVARQFGIETDTSSFNYLAAYTQGFDLQDLKKSLTVIYNECKKLTQEISAELDARGLNLDLTEKPVAPMEKESVEALSKQYTAYVLEQSETIQSRMAELPAIVADNRTNPDLLSVLKEQKSCLDRQEASMKAIMGGVEKLQGATTREAQNEAVEEIKAAKRSMEGEKTRFSDLTTSFAEISSQSKATLKEEFARDPKTTLEAMKQDYPKLESLSAAQLSYLAQSEYVKKEYANLLKSEPDKFVDAACQRAEMLDKVVAKNGAFVEVNFCEQWTDKPVVQDGALLHPNVANSIVKQAETQIRRLRSEAEKTGDYFPYTKCDLTVFYKGDGKDLSAYRTRVDIGDKGQTSLTDHLTQLCGKESDLVTDFSKATRERGAKEKIAFNEAPETHEEAKEDEQEMPDASTHEEWANAIEQEKAGEESRTQEQEQEKQKNKDNKEH